MAPDGEPTPGEHSRAELLARDPDLYDLIVRVTRTPNPDPLLRRLGPRILEFYEWAGDGATLAQVRSLLATLALPGGAPDPK